MKFIKRYWKFRFKSRKGERQPGYSKKNKLCANTMHHHCLLLISTGDNDSEEDEKCDCKHYKNYKMRHPNDGYAIWKNHKEGREYIYHGGTENIITLSNSNEIEEEIKSILQYLHSDEAKSKKFCIVKGYDFVWIKYAIDKELFNGCDRLYFKSMPAFIAFIQNLGFTKISKEETLNKYYKYVQGRYPYYRYSDNMGKTVSETQRRNNIIKNFVEKMRELRGYDEQQG